MGLSQVVELAAECAIALEIRLDSSTLISADWVRPAPWHQCCL